MFTSPYSFIITAGLRPLARQWSRRRCRRVVLPLPRKPEMRWVGIRSASEKRRRSFVSVITRQLFQDCDQGERREGGGRERPPHRAQAGKGGETRPSPGVCVRRPAQHDLSSYGCLGGGGPSPSRLKGGVSLAISARGNSFFLPPPDTPR